MSPRDRTYLERPIPSALIFGVFVIVVVPLAVLQWVPNFVEAVPCLALLVAIGLGTSHFFLTLGVYLPAAQRAYMTSTRQRQLIYFALPLAILLLLAFIEASKLRVYRPGIAALFFAAVRALDFLHVGRQSFGVQQLMKRGLPRVPARLRTLENLFFVGLAALQWQTFWDGGVFPSDRARAWLPALALCGVFLVVFGYYARRAFTDWERSWRPWLYFSVQAVCAAAAAFRTWLYLTVLAVHYLEYHVLMYPRLFSAPGEDSRSRWLPWLSGPLALYSALAVVVIAFELRALVVTESTALSFVVHLFDGIFLLHYVLDAFLWRFSQPFYGEQLGRLYLQPAAANATRWRWRPWVCGATLLLLVTLAAGIFGDPRRMAHLVFDPIHAHNHTRWGVEAIQRSEMREAHRHLLEAVQRDPEARYARAALDWVEMQITASSRAQRSQGR